MSPVSRKTKEKDMDKPTILFISRGRRDKMFADTIEAMKDKYDIILLAEPESLEAYRNISRIKIEHFYNEKEIQELSFKVTSQELEKIPAIEQELGLNCYEFNMNYLLYRKYVDRYGAGDKHKFENEHIPQRLYIAYKTVTKLIRKYGIEYCFYETLDTVESYILTAMAQKGIIKQAFEHSVESLGGEVRVRINTGQYRRSHKIEYMYENKLASNKALEWTQRTIEQNKSERLTSKYDDFHVQLGTLLPRFSTRQIINKIKEVTSGEPFLPALIKISNRIRCAKYFSEKIPDSKIITYFLQLTPEASMCSQIPEYTDQEYLIEQMAIHGKHGYTIAVKEHPSCYGNRRPSFYRELSMLPNVVLLPPSYPTRELIQQSNAIVVATGTSPGLESIITGTPVIALGHPYFDICDNVYSINRPENIWDIIEDVKTDKNAQQEFIAAMYHATYAHPQFDSAEEHEVGTGVGNVMAKALDDEISLYENGTLK